MIPVATVLPLLRGASRPPVDGGTVEELEVDGFFRLHFTRDGADAVPSDEVVPTIRDALRDAKASYEASGWRTLVRDDGVDGAEIDVYVRVLPVYGYATPVPVDGDGSSCHLQIDPGSSVDGGVLRSVVFHELHHCVQFRYTTVAPSFLYESGATLQQYSLVQDPTLDLASGVLWYQWLDEAERPLSVTDGRHEYAAFVFSKFWTERGSLDRDRLERLWTQLADPADTTEPSWIGTLDRAARDEWGDGLDEAFLDHATWNAFACGNDDGAHYLPDGAPCTVDASVEALPFEPGAQVVHDEEPYTAAYRLVEAEASSRHPVRLECSGPGESRLVARDVGGVEVAEESGDDVQVEVPEGGSALLVLTGNDARPLSRRCELVAPRSSVGGGCSTAPAAPAWLLAAGLLALLRRRR